MATIIRIDPDGTITDIEGSDILAVAQPVFDSIDVVTCRAPIFQGSLVGVIDDWGRVNGLPLNRKAWACYGRSPIFGPMFLAHDQDDDGHREPLDPALIALLRLPVESIVPAHIITLMDEVLRNEGADR